MTIHVHRGDSIQTAVNSASRGDTVLVHPGTYREDGRSCPTESAHSCAVLIREDGIRLVAKRSRRRRVVLKASGGQDEGIAVVGSNDPSCVSDRSKRLHRSLIKGFTVKGFDDDGVFLYCVDRYRVTRVRAINNNEYGIFPSHSVSGRVDHSFASGANDTGIYIGQSRRGRVDHNRATRNVSGFEIENSSRVRADHNVAIGNTAGILSFALSGLDVKSNRSNRIDHNRVRRNNKRNTCVDPDDTVCKVPSGTGILLLAVDKNLVQRNRVSGNKTFGIAVANYCLGLQLSAADCSKIDIEPNPDGNRLTRNRARGNGFNPDPFVPLIFAVDLAWDTTGNGNCWSRNAADRTFPSPLPGCP
jgi:parallel beta-helix repeat protein